MAGMISDEICSNVSGPPHQAKLMIKENTVSHLLAPQIQNIHPPLNQQSVWLSEKFDPPYSANICACFVCVAMQSKIMGCENCRDLFSTLGSLQASSPGKHKTSTEPVDEEKDGLKEQLRQLELDLAQTKLQLVEAKCRIQVSCRLKSQQYH